VTRFVRSGEGPIFPSTAPEWLERLLLRGRNAARKIGREDAACIAFADRCREWSLTGKLRATWTHIPHEVGGGGFTKSDGKGGRVRIGAVNAQLRYSLAKAMGLITGSADYVFVWKGGGGWMEFKAPSETATAHRPKRRGGTLTEEQKLFRDWCQSLGVEHRVVTSFAEAAAVLREWGVLEGE
jgi:hypothetical protein